MSHLSTAKRSGLFAAATAITTLGFVAAPSGQADPGQCAQYGFNGPFTVRGTNGWTVNFTSNGTSAVGPATVTFQDGGTVHGDLISGGIRGNVIDFAILWNDKPNNQWNFHGTVGDDARVHDGGESLGAIPEGYTGEVASGWSSTTPLACLDAPAPAPAEAPKPAEPPPQQQQPPPQQQAPPVTDAIRLSFSRPSLNSITATVTNSSALTAKCTYDATAPLVAPTHRDFTVGPTATTQLNFSGLAIGATYHVVVSCHDASGTQPQEIGHAEQDVTF